MELVLEEWEVVKTTGAHKVTEVRLRVDAKAGNLLCVVPCPCAAATLTLSAQKKEDGVSMIMAPSFLVTLGFAGERK